MAHSFESPQSAISNATLRASGSVCTENVDAERAFCVDKLKHRPIRSIERVDVPEQESSARLSGMASNHSAMKSMLFNARTEAWHPPAQAVNLDCQPAGECPALNAMTAKFAKGMQSSIRVGDG